jgi:hypothetical protein
MPQSKSAQNARIGALRTLIDVEHVRKQIGGSARGGPQSEDRDGACQPFRSVSDLIAEYGRRHSLASSRFG